MIYITKETKELINKALNYNCYNGIINIYLDKFMEEENLIVSDLKNKDIKESKKHLSEIIPNIPSIS